MTLQKGFNLIELMTVTAIVAILATVAMPAYNDYVVKSKIPDATSALSSMHVRMEQCFQDNRSYVNCTCVTSTTYFDISCTAAPTTNAYTLQAVGKNPGPMAGFTYTIDQNNIRQTTAAPLVWQAAAMPTSCWITKVGGGC